MDKHLAFTRFTGKRLHLGVCGSIAAFKALDLLRKWRDAGFDVGATLTASAQRFVTPLSFAALGASPVHTAMFAADSAAAADADVYAHLTPGSSAHCYAVVPASATTLARLAHGLADEILSCQALAFDGPLVVAPAMNPRMWANPATKANWNRLRERGCVLVAPTSGRVACMEEGEGRLADLRAIYIAVLSAVSPKDLAGRSIMITLGPTREYWDGVRYWTNPSTGLMGASLAVAAHLRGATVHAVCGPGVMPGEPWLPPDVIRHDVISAREMFAAASDLWPDMDVGIFTAAVADFSPLSVGEAKSKKAAHPEGFTLSFTSNADILQTLAAARRPGQKVIGFAAETGDLEAQVRQKLTRKHADLVIGNLVGPPGMGFASATNSVLAVDSSGNHESWDNMTKPDLAWRILDWLLRL